MGYICCEDMSAISECYCGRDCQPIFHCYVPLVSGYQELSLGCFFTGLKVVAIARLIETNRRRASSASSRVEPKG